MSYPSEKVRIVPLLGKSATAGGTSLFGKTRHNGGDFSICCFVSGGTAGATEVTATAAANWDFSVLEASAASAAGSVITGATMTLGAATALTLRGAAALVCKVATNLATTVSLTLNGIAYHTSTAGATADSGAVALARMINGGGAGATAKPKLPHYTAVANFSSNTLLLITPDDDMGTGITAVATSGGVQIFVNHLQGVINVKGAKLSTVTPKYIGVGCTALTGIDTSIICAHMVTWPTAGPATPGVKVNCTT